MIAGRSVFYAVHVVPRKVGDYFHNLLFLFWTQKRFQTNFAHAVDPRYKAGVGDIGNTRVTVTLAFERSGISNHL
jgi:hypothetical protein